MRKTRRRLGALLLTAAMLFSLLPTAAFAATDGRAGGTVNLITPQCAVTASSGQDTAALAIDGGTTAGAGHQWVSDDMKTGGDTADPDGTQIPQWLTVDLGAGHTDPVAIDSIKLWYNAKVWPMVYEIQTSATGDPDGTWTTLVRVERSPFAGGVKNGAGQDIADETGNDNAPTAANTDTITKTSHPALAEDAAVQRYVRFYVEKVNTSAPGNNVCLVEIQVLAPAAPEEPIEGAWNLALGRTASASSVVNDLGPELAVDGVTGAPQWNSEDMKTASTTEADAQTPQWLQVDLGATGSRIDHIKLYYNVKVWPMVYEIQTTDTPDAAQSWETVVRVERSPFDGAVKNGAGQNIADETGNSTPATAANTDTITADSIPALQTTTLKRYVRFYVEKVNTAAAGHNINLREIEIYGVNDALHPPVDVNAVLSGVTAADLTAGGASIGLPAVADGAGLVVRGSTLENVVKNDGTIGGKNIGSRAVTLLLRASDLSNPETYAEKNLTVTVPDHKDSYPAEWFPAVANPNAKPEVIPTIQEWYGYTGSFTLTENSRIVINDAAGVNLQKAAENMKADVKEISGLDLPIVAGTQGGASDIYIESLTRDSYDLGDEGYLMRVSGEGVKIYAPTYTGCIFGTITVEQILWQAADHRSVPMGIMRDYPAYEVRGIKLDIARTPYRYQQLQDYAKIMLWYKMSEYDLHINDNDNANIDKSSASLDTHSGFHRLESETFPSLTSGTKHAGIPADLVNADYYNNNPDYQGNPAYTKEQWRALEQLARDYGMYLLTEIDLPAHSLAYNQYAQENPDNIDWLEGGTMPASTFTSNAGYLELLDLTGTNKDRALRFAKELWDEYTSGPEPTIYGDIIHIGADEYWVHNTATNNAFAVFVDEMRQVIQDNLGADTKLRMWGAGAGSGSFTTATTALNTTHAELARHFQLDIWHTSYENPAQRAREGYQIINCRDSFLYGNPGRSNRDVPNAEYLFYDWNPTMFGGNNPLLGEPNLMGAKAVIWGDQSQEGMTERDIHQRVLRAIAIVSEKTWGGTDEADTFSDYELRAARLAEGPGTQIAMELSSETSLVLDYDFSSLSSDGSTVYDASGNGYNAALVNGTVDADGWLTFDGSTLLTTGLKTLSYPYTVTFDLKAAPGNTAESSLFSGYDGRIQAAGHNGHMSADVNYFTRDFGYTLPTDGTAVNITIVGTFQATRLYVNGELTAFLSQKQDQDGVAPGNVQTLYSSVLLPLEKIGQDFHGEMAGLKVYNKAFSASEVAEAFAGTDDGLVNVAQNAIAGGSSYASGDASGQDNATQRNCTAAKAVDGEAFTDNQNSSSELWSYWQGDHADSALTVDLGQTRTISRVDLQWRSNGIGGSFKLQTSMDGKTWNDAKSVTGNTSARQAVALDAPVETRYVRMQGVSGTYKLQELLIYEQVDKTGLAELLAQAEAIVDAKSLDFETTGSDQALFNAVVFARAVNESPLSTIADVEKAVGRLTAVLPDIYTITVDSGITHGTVTPSKTSAAQGEEITLTIIPDSGYQLKAGSLEVNHGAVAVTDNKFTMPGENVTITAEFELITVPPAVYTITVDSGITHGTVTPSKTSAAQGEEITLTVTPDSGYQLKAGSLEVNHGAVAVTDSKFTMPGENVTITAEFELITVPPTVYTITVDSGIAHGTVTPSKTSAAQGEEITLTVTSDSGYQLKAGSLEVNHGAVTVADNKFTMPGENVTITAEFELITVPPAVYTITVDSGIAHGTVTPSKTSAAQGEEITLTVTPDSGYQLKAGSLEVNHGAVTVTDNKFTMPGENVTITAEFEAVDNPPAPPVNPGTPGTPSTPPTTTEIKDNGDGTTTTIVTDNRTGTVTETTEKADGTVEVVETRKDGTVTETITDPEGGKVEKVTNPDRDVAITVTGKDGEVLAEVEIPAKIPASETRFVDVPVGHWADEAIHNMAALEVVNGIGNDRYDMNGNMTRGALATVLSRLSNGQEGFDAGFADVADGQWYADGIAWAAKTGVVTGYSETEFGPNDPITREQLAVMLCRYARLLGMDTTTDTGALWLFADGGSTHDWAAESVAWCVERGILQGKGNATLAPTATAVRAEVAVMLQRFIDLMK